eukprot:4733222-Pleurochrysis_carterae.AAC.1
MGIGNAAIVDRPGPCRKSVFRLGRRAAVRPRPEWHNQAARGNTQLHPAVVRPAGKQRRNPIDACACRR